jgi:protein transport protein SEC31
VIVGGCDGGIMEVYDGNKILDLEEQALVLTKNKHSGPVRALDFNPARVRISILAVPGERHFCIPY